jgi:hypothetical protein
MTRQAEYEQRLIENMMKERIENEKKVREFIKLHLYEFKRGMPEQLIHIDNLGFEFQDLYFLPKFSWLKEKERCLSKYCHGDVIEREFLPYHEYLHGLPDGYKEGIFCWKLDDDAKLN